MHGRHQVVFLADITLVSVPALHEQARPVSSLKNTPFSRILGKNTPSVQSKSLILRPNKTPPFKQNVTFFVLRDNAPFCESKQTQDKCTSYLFIAFNVCLRFKYIYDTCSFLTLFKNFADLYLKNNPFSSSKKYPFFAKMGTSMGVRFGGRGGGGGWDGVGGEGWEGVKQTDLMGQTEPMIS